MTKSTSLCEIREVLEGSEAYDVAKALLQLSRAKLAKILNKVYGQDPYLRDPELAKKGECVVEKKLLEVAGSMEVARIALEAAGRLGEGFALHGLLWLRDAIIRSREKIGREKYPHLLVYAAKEQAFGFTGRCIEDLAEKLFLPSPKQYVAAAGIDFYVQGNSASYSKDLLRVAHAVLEVGWTMPPRNT